MKNIIVMTLKLLVITLVAGVILGVVNAVTKEPIAVQAAKEADEARKAAFSEAVSFESMEITIEDEKYDIINNVFNALDADGNIIGITAGLTTKGFNAGLSMTVGIGADGTIKGMIIGNHSETPGLGAKATEDWFQEQYNNKPYDKPLNVVKTAPSETYDIQAITSATITSKGVTNAVNMATEFYQEMVGGTK